MNGRRSKLLFTAAALLCAIACAVTIHSQGASQTPSKGASQEIDQTRPDGPVSVSMGDVFERGATKVELADKAKLPSSVPAGFVPLNGNAYKFTTTAVVSGPYDIVFKITSVTDEQAFKNLRILHLEPDEFDPDSYVWIDRTAASDHDSPGQDFKEKTITGHSEELDAGIYMVARVVPKVDRTADLEVTAKGSPETVQLPGNAALAVTVKNNGPDVATNVGAMMDQSRVGGYLVSVSPSQGNCKATREGVFCKLGQIAAGASLTIKVVFEPTAGFSGEYESQIRVGGNEKDSNADNNVTTGSVLTLADPNVAPEVTLETPRMEQLIEEGSPISLKATASDADGSITKVEFFDFNRSLGIGATTDAKHFTLTSGPLSNGNHHLFAVATDNGGRATPSSPNQVFVNGPIRVRIVEPKMRAVIQPGSEFTVVAETTHPSGSIKSLKFMFTHGMLFGEATQVQDNRFEFTVRAERKMRYSIVAVATDDAGLVSKSEPVDFAATIPPTVSIATPVEGVSLTAPATVQLVLNYKSNQWLSRVEIYANDQRIDEGAAPGAEGNYSFTWKRVKAGRYSLKAVVFDDLGVRAESTSVKIVVKDRH